MRRREGGGPVAHRMVGRNSPAALAAKSAAKARKEADTAAAMVEEHLRKQRERAELERKAAEAYEVLKAQGKVT